MTNKRAVIALFLYVMAFTAYAFINGNLFHH